MSVPLVATVSVLASPPTAGEEAPEASVFSR